MKKKLILFTFIVMALACVFTASISAEAVFVNHNGEQVSADSEDIAYELEINNPWEKGGNCSIRYIYLHDDAVTKIIIPAIELTHPNGTVYKMAEYSYVRLATGWSATLSVYALDDKETKSNSLHTQITELEFHIPVLGDGAGQFGNLANWTGLEKLSFFAKAYEPQAKGGFLQNCTSLKEIHFYGKENYLTGNFFPSSLMQGGKIMFHNGATGVITSCAMQDLNGKDCTVYLNTSITPKDDTDPRLTWNKNSNGLLKFVLLVNDASFYTAEQILSYETQWQAGNNKNASNAKYSMPIQTYCDYYGEHINMEAQSTCVLKCLICKEIAVPENPVHNLDISIVYADYAIEGTKTTKCLNADCALNITPTVEATEPLFTFKGYSTNGKEICVGYLINLDAINDYELRNDNVALKYGFIASANNNTPLDVADKVINIDLTDSKYTGFDFKLTSKWDTDEKKDAKITMNLYTVLVDGDNVKASYVYGYNDGEALVSQSYGIGDSISYNDLNPALNK